MKIAKISWKNHRFALLLLPLLFSAPLLAQDYSQSGQPDAQQDIQQGSQQNAQDDQNNPPGRVARLSEISGNVSLQPSGETDWTAATQNYTVSSGDRLYTDTGSQAALEIGPFAVRMSQLTDLTVVNLNDQLAQFGIAQGTTQITIFQLPEGNTVELDTPNGALTLQSPGTYRADIDPTNGYTLVSVYRGNLLVSGGDVSQTVGEGQAVKLTGSDQIQVASASLAPVDDFENWVQSRDNRISSAHTDEHVSPYMPGAADLDAYGQWQTGPDGPVWYPSGVAPGWVPYRVGHWAWIEPWGWTWVEGEPWGFAPFHYGRWAFYGGRWGWLPGPVIVAPIYSPALVAFVGGPGFSVGFGVGGFGLSAWFPLGPGEPFIPWYHYGPRYLREVNVTNIRNVTNINITNVQNIHYAYRTTAVTAVDAQTFRSGQPVQRGLVKVTPEQMARAQVIAHPPVNPAKTAIVSHPVAPPKGIRPTTNFVAISRTAHPAPVVTSRTNTPPSQTYTNPPPGDSRNMPPATKAMAPTAPANNGRYSSPTALRPPFVTKNPPPPPPPAFSTRQPAMSSHPGRPLEPQQLNNLRNGKPAGPQQDRELSPHAVPPPRVAPTHQAPPHNTPPPTREEKNPQ